MRSSCESEIGTRNEKSPAFAFSPENHPSADMAPKAGGLTQDDYNAAKDKQTELMKPFKGKMSHQVAKDTPKAVKPELVRTMKASDLGKVYCVTWNSKSDLIMACHQEGAITVKKATNGGHMNLPVIFPKKEEKIVPMAGTFFNDDKMIAVGGMDNVITLFDRSSNAPEKKKVLVNHEGYISAIKVLGDKLLSGSGDSTIRLWDPNSGAEIKEFLDHEADCSGVDCIAGDPNMFVSSSTDTTCRVWDARTGKTTRVFKAKYGVNCISIHPTGKMLACGCDSASFEYWDIGSYNQIARGKVKKGRCETICFSSSGALTWMGWDSPEAGFVTCAETFFVDKQAKADDKETHTETVTTMSVSPDGSAMATGGFDSLCKIWAAPAAAA